MVEVAMLQELSVRETDVAKHLGWSYGTGVFHAQARGLGRLFKQKRGKTPQTKGTHRISASRDEVSSAW